MTRLRRRRKKAAPPPPGAWLAFLAIATQVLLPFLVAFEISLASSPAYADRTTFICSASRLASPATPARNGRVTHHGLSDGCPICTALAAGQAFTATSPVILPLPKAVATPAPERAHHFRAPAIAAASYLSRAPPSIA
jgi:Protein of unknown function (DUF2946)